MSLHCNVWPEAVYCCFTRTTLFTTIFTVNIVVCALFLPCFILIDYCVSELHSHMCPYRNVWPEAVYCCFTRNTELFSCLYDQSLRLISLHQVSLLYSWFLR